MFKKGFRYQEHERGRSSKAPCALPIVALIAVGSFGHRRPGTRDRKSKARAHGAELLSPDVRRKRCTKLCARGFLPCQWCISWRNAVHGNLQSSQQPNGLPWLKCTCESMPEAVLTSLRRLTEQSTRSCVARQEQVLASCFSEG